MGSHPHFCEFYLWDPHQVLTVKIREKSPPASSKGRGRQPILEICPGDIIILKCAQRIPFCDLKGSCRSLTYLGQEKCPPPAPLASLSGFVRGVGALRSTEKAAARGRRLSQGPECRAEEGVSPHTAHHVESRSGAGRTARRRLQLRRSF